MFVWHKSENNSAKLQQLSVSKPEPLLPPHCPFCSLGGQYACCQYAWELLIGVFVTIRFLKYLSHYVVIRGSEIRVQVCRLYLVGWFQYNVKFFPDFLTNTFGFFLALLCLMRLNWISCPCKVFSGKWFRLIFRFLRGTRSHFSAFSH